MRHLVRPGQIGRIAPKRKTRDSDLLKPESFQLGFNFTRRSDSTVSFLCHEHVTRSDTPTMILSRI